ncbi:hypothetical protein GCM10011511_31040 [Puia dinghuensis]|uniref:Pectate lyase superfamily protein domain-containing protein n=2 Tax=Puia dinghuensis TaxID=1792502 RepID=A0A8J2UE78_9BACT|nr:hypothetical protein GCM10011511_31040 [Puia dinghuensis]
MFKWCKLISVMEIRFTLFIVLTSLFCGIVSAAQERYGAYIPWTTYEAEQMTTTGSVLGPKYGPYQVETESSGQRCVKLTAKGQYLEFAAIAPANSLVIRYSLQDGPAGEGLSARLSIYKNGRFVDRCVASSRYAWLYGKYPFSNDPAMGSPRHFYDEIRVKGLQIRKGDVIRIRWDDGPGEYCIIDLVDLEAIAPPLKRPLNSLSLMDFSGNAFNGDYTQSLRDCIARAVLEGKAVWIPAGSFKLTGDILLPANVTIQGAGMWYTELVGDDNLYADANRRVRLKGNGSNIHIADLAITGKLDHRNDKEPNDGIVGSFGRGSTISRVWIEQTKVGMWIENSDSLRITGCRIRNTMADGINFCVGMSRSIIEQCTARGTGDDCFAVWPAVYSRQLFSPGNNLVLHCTGQLPYLANGAALYGGESNVIRDCAFTDITAGSGILISTTFPTSSRERGIDNNFSGTTVVENCAVKTCGGFDHEWGWRAALEICTDKRSIAGVIISNVHIDSSLSNGVSVIARNGQTLSDAVLRHVSVAVYGVGADGKYGLFIPAGARGRMDVRECSLGQVENEGKEFRMER